MNKIKIAIIGMGRMGRMRYDGFIQHGGFEVISICDNNLALLEQYPVAKYTDYKKCIDESNPDAVIVCTYNAFIPDIVCYALERGKHVFSEKPPGRCLDDVIRMKKSLDASPGKVLKFGFNHRYHNSVIEAKNLIDSGLFGELICARGVYGKAGNMNFSHEWRNNKNYSGGGILIDQGIHMLDLLCYFIGNFTKVECSVDNLGWKDIETDDSAFAILKNDRNQVASLHSSALQWRHKFSLDLICSNGYITLNGLKTSTDSYGIETLTYYKKDLELRSGKLGKPLEHTMFFESD